VATATLSVAETAATSGDDARRAGSAAALPGHGDGAPSCDASEAGPEPPGARRAPLNVVDLAASDSEADEPTDKRGGRAAGGRDSAPSTPAGQQRFAFFQNGITPFEESPHLTAPLEERPATVSIPFLTMEHGGLQEAWVCTMDMYAEPARFFEVFPGLLAAGRLVLVHGYEDRDREKAISAAFREFVPDTTCFCPYTPPYGTHHSKAFVLFYEDKVRVIIHTANLIDEDLFKKSEGVWFQDFPRRSALGGAESSASPAWPAAAIERFGPRLNRYFAHLFANSRGAVRAANQRSLLARLDEHDFTGASAALIATVPGKSTRADGWGLHGLAASLRTVVHGPRCEWPIVLQFTSMGSQRLSGRQAGTWLEHELAAVMANPVKPRAPRAGQLSIVFPTGENCVESNLGMVHGLFCHAADYVNLANHFCAWDASTGFPSRQRAMPHIKSYAAYNPVDPRELAWCCITSANCSKSAWGALRANGDLYARSYELGVLVAPGLAGVPGTHKLVTRHGLPGGPRGRQAPVSGQVEVVAPLPYLLPPRRYPRGSLPGPLAASAAKASSTALAALGVAPRLASFRGAPRV